MSLAPHETQNSNNLRAYHIDPSLIFLFLITHFHSGTKHYSVQYFTVSLCHTHTTGTAQHLHRVTSQYYIIDWRVESA